MARPTPLSSLVVVAVGLGALPCCIPDPNGSDGPSLDEEAAEGEGEGEGKGEGKGEGEGEVEGEGEGEGVLKNYVAGCTVDALNPTLPGEAGFLALETFAAPSSSFTVGGVRYALVNDGVQCDATLAHEVFVFVFPGTDPPTSPSTNAQSIGAALVPADPARTDGVLSLTVALSEPYVLTPGERLGVAVRLNDDDNGHSLCLGMCVEDVRRDVSFWSNAADEPYAWEDLVGGFSLGNLLIEATAP